MELRVFKTMWGHPAGVDPTAEARARGYDGLEGPAHLLAPWAERLVGEGLGYIAEICTAGSYVPRAGATPAEHLATFHELAEASVELEPHFLTVLAGSDAWPVDTAVEFFGEAMRIAAALDIEVSFETHRSRCFFHPWHTREIVRQLPGLQLTCDFSHWCCVCERLVLDEEPELLTFFASRARHVHARVGYDQGPQVPHPAAPEYATALEAHERWWDAIWDAQEAAGQSIATLTPESGPDGYLHTLPFTGAPVANLGEINLWMAEWERARFAARTRSPLQTV